MHLSFVSPELFLRKCWIGSFIRLFQTQNFNIGLRLSRKIFLAYEIFQSFYVSFLMLGSSSSPRTSSVGSVDWFNNIFRDICLNFLTSLSFHCYWLRSSQIKPVDCFFLEMTKSLKISSLISLSLIHFTKIWSLSCFSFCCVSELDSLNNIMFFIVVIWLLFVWHKNSGDFYAFLSYSFFFTTTFFIVSSPCCTKCPTKKSYLDPVGFIFFASSLFCMLFYFLDI